MSVFAQGSLYKDVVYRYTPAGIFAASGSTVTICTSGGTGQPCTPKVTVYSDSALTQPVANPLIPCTVSPQFGCIDGLGNFSFYATPGAYTYTVTGIGIQAYGPIPANLSCIAGLTCLTNPASSLVTFNAGISLFAGLTCTGSSGPVLSCTGLRGDLNGSGASSATWRTFGTANSVDTRFGSELFNPSEGDIGTSSNHPFGIYTNSTKALSVDTLQGVTALHNLIATAGANQFSCKYMQQIRCVDAGNSPTWSGSDVGAWINAAYADCPTLATSGSTFCKIIVAPKSDGSCYTATTLINLSTNGKPAILDFQGACLDYSGVTSGNYITLDWGQGSPQGYGGWVGNLHLLGACATTACSGVTANGLNLGPTNGLVGTVFENLILGGFNSGKGFANAVNFGSLAYIIQLRGTFVYSSKVGVNYPVGNEGVTFYGGAIAQNATGVQTAGSGSEIRFIGTQFDDNTTTNYNRQNSTTFIATFIDCHFENAGLGTLTVLTDAGSSGLVKYIGGDIQDDIVTAGGGVSLMNFSGSNLKILGMSAFSAGQNVTQIVSIGNSSSAFLDFNTVGGPISADYNAATLGSVLDISFSTAKTLTMQGGWRLFLGPNGGDASHSSGLYFTETSGLVGAASGTDFCAGNSATHTLQCSYNNSGLLNMMQVITTTLTTTAATTDNVTVTGMTASGHCYLTPTNSGAAGGIASVFISNKTTNQITVTHTATSGWTFDVVCSPQ